MFTDFFNAAASINLLILPLTDSKTISMPPNAKNSFICQKKCERGMDCGMLLISKQTLYLINYGMMKIIMMIFYKEKIYFINQTKINIEDFVFGVMHRFMSVNLNTFVFAEAKKDCL
jgi:hypothetical protein